MKNKVIQTVTGLIEISKLGITLIHEHLIINILFYGVNQLKQTD